jgi:hypothetical protein
LTTLFCSKLFKPNQHCRQNSVEFRTLSGEYVLLAAAANVVIFSERSGRRRRRFWVCPSLHSRQRYTGRDLLRDLNCDDCALSIRERRLAGSFMNFTRISSSDFEFLLNNIARISKTQTTGISILTTMLRVYNNLSNISLMFTAH